MRWELSVFMSYQYFYFPCLSWRLLIKQMRLIILLMVQREGMKTTIQLIPNIMGMIVAIKVFLASGIIDAIANMLNPLLTAINLDAHVLPLMILRPLSGSAALSVTTDLISIYGPDSTMGRLVSIMQGSTDTTIYIITVYFAAVGLSEMKHALKLGLTADVIGFVASVLAVSFFF